jgi:NAD-specific glutamate dehydrogenase
MNDSDLQQKRKNDGVMFYLQMIREQRNKLLEEMTEEIEEEQLISK